MLFEAFESWEREKSTSTGLPTWLTRDADNGVWFEVDSEIDGADKAISDFDDKEAKAKEKRNGLARWAIPTVAKDQEIPAGGLAREAALKRMKKAADAMAEATSKVGKYNKDEYDLPADM